MVRTTSNRSLWSAEMQDHRQWPSLCLENYSKSKKSKIRRRQLAVQLYLDSAAPIADIVGRTGISKSEIYRFVERVFSPLGAGVPQRWNGILPDVRIVEYKRTTKRDSGTAGTFEQLLTNFDIKEETHAIILGKVKIHGCFPRGGEFEGRFRKWVELCKKCGIDTEHDYPFSNERGALNAFRNYAKRLLKHHFVDEVRMEHGDHAANMLLAAGTGHDLYTGPGWPFDVAQIDGHKCDVMITLSVDDGNGDEQLLPLSRIWILMLMETASRACLGYSLSLGKEYSAYDFVNCINSSLTPWEPIYTPNKNPLYLKGAGLPNAVSRGGRRFVCNTTRHDNAKAHSGWAHDKLMGIGFSEIVSNCSGAPRSDSIVERVFRTIEEISLHQYPNTTGSNPDDPRRIAPEQAAAKYRFTYDHLAQLVDIVIANYNISPHDSLNGRSPLQYLDTKIASGKYYFREYQEKLLSDSGVFDRNYNKTVLASKKSTAPPYIDFYYARYTSEQFSQRSDLIGKRVIVQVNVEDVRRVRVYTEQGDFIDELNVHKRWSHHKHSLKVRQNINKNKVLLKRSKYYVDPVGAYFEYLETSSKNHKTEANKLLALKKQMGDIDSIHNEDPTETLYQTPIRRVDLSQIDLTAD